MGNLEEKTETVAEAQGSEDAEVQLSQCHRQHVPRCVARWRQHPGHTSTRTQALLEGPKTGPQTPRGGGGHRGGQLQVWGGPGLWHRAGGGGAECSPCSTSVGVGRTQLSQELKGRLSFCIPVSAAEPNATGGDRRVHGRLSQR